MAAILRAKAILLKNLTIIGFGIMGQIFAKELKNFFSVTVWNRSDKSDIAKKIGVRFESDMQKAVSAADIILICVPISAFEQMIKKISGFAKNALIADVCSVKEMPMQVMEKHFKKYVGMHPLFGRVKSVKGYKIVVCRGIGDCGVLLYALRKSGAKIIELSAAEHDKILGEIQGMTHLIGLGVIDYLKKLDIEKLKKVSTPTFDFLLALAERMQNNNPQVFLEIQKYNKHAHEARKTILEKLKNVSKKMDSQS